MNVRRALIVFTRLPIAGAVKTRLQAAYSPEQCAALQRAMLTDIADAIREADADIIVFYGTERSADRPGDDGDALPTADESEALASLEATFGERAAYYEQRGDDFGARLRDAYRRCRTFGYERVAFLGSDWVEIDPAELDEAFALLEAHDCVLKPMADGGYGLMALAGWHPEVFEIGNFGGATVLAETIERLRTAGLRYALLPPGFDIDLPQDVAALWERLGRDDGTYAPRTYRWLHDHRGKG